jgi:hypothetical protein
MRHHHSFSAAVFGLVLWSVGASAEVQCTDKLLGPDLKINLTASQSRTYLRYAMCRSTFEEFRDTYGAQTGASYLDIYKGKGDFSEDRYKSVKGKQCANLSKDEVNSALAFSSSSVVPKEARDAYLQCLKLQQGLACDLAPGVSVPLVTIYQNFVEDGAVTIRSLDTENGTVGSIKIGDTVNRGETPLSVRNFSRPFRFTLGATKNGANFKCTVFVDAPLPPPPPRHVERAGEFTFQQGSPNTAWLGDGKPGFDLSSTFDSPACMKASDGFKLIRSTIRISPPRVDLGRRGGGQAICKEDDMNKPSIPLDACEGNKTEDEICYRIIMSSNGGTVVRYKWTIFGDEALDER